MALHKLRDDRESAIGRDGIRRDPELCWRAIGSGLLVDVLELDGDVCVRVAIVDASSHEQRW